MSLEELQQFVPVYVLVFFRLAGMIVFAPLLGSAKIPKRVKVMLALVLALAVTPSVTRPAALPPTAWQTAVGIGGEMIFGIAMGMIVSLVFTAAQWAGQMVSQQMGLNLSEVFDPQMGGQGSLIGDLYYMLALVIFLLIRGHHALLSGVVDSFQTMPLLSLGMDRGMLDAIVGLVSSSTTLAFQLAAPVFVAMLVVDLALGFIGKTMPQFNIMSAGLTLRSMVGIVVLIFGLVLTSEVMRGALLDSLRTAGQGWRTGALP